MLCLFWGCRKSILQNSRWLAYSLVRGLWISLPTLRDYSFIKALVLDKGHYQVYEILFWSWWENMNYTLDLWFLSLGLTPVIFKFWMEAFFFIVLSFVTVQGLLQLPPASRSRVKQAVVSALLSALYFSFGFDSQRSHLRELTFAFLF